MATIVDQFIVTLGLDPTKYLAGKKQVDQSVKDTKNNAHRAGQEMEASGQQAAKFFSQIKNEAMALGTVLFGGVGIAEFIKNTIDGNAAVGRFSANIGASTEQLSAWEGAIKSVGGTVADVTGSLGALSEAYQNFKIGVMPSAEFQKALALLNHETGSNITLADMADPTRAAMMLSQAAQKLPRPEANTILKMLGQSENMRNLELLGPEKLNALLASMAHVTDAQSAAAQQTQAQLAATTGRFKDLSNELITGMLPALDATAKDATALIDVVKVLTSVIAPLTKFVNDLDKIPFVHAMMQTMGAVFNPLGAAADALPGADAALRRVTGGQVPTPVPNIAAGPREGWWPALPAAGGVTAPAAGGAAASDRGVAIQSALVRAGLSGDQAAGVAAWVFAESQFNTGARNRKGGGHGALGIGQWRGSRQRALLSQYGPNPTFDQQLAFLVSEILGGDPGGAAVRGSSGGAAAALLATITKFGRGSPSDNAGDYRRGLQYLGGGRHRTHHTAHHSRAETHIGTINVNGVDTNKADAVAQGLKPALSRYGTVTQANTGLF